MTNRDPQFEPAGDRAVVVRFGDTDDDDTFARIRQALPALARGESGVLDAVAGFTTITVHYDPARVATHAGEGPYAALVERLAARLATVDAGGSHPEAGGRLCEIPVCYEGELAPDLGEVARATRLAIDDLVALHTAPEYSVRVIGFIPGFAYLTGLDPRLATPRRAEPRTRVPAGSVGIGGTQTGIYPVTAPGGWQLIGRTPLRLFDAGRSPGAVLAVGDRVRFRPIRRAEFDAADGA